MAHESADPATQGKRLVAQIWTTLQAELGVIRRDSRTRFRTVDLFTDSKKPSRRSVLLEYGFNEGEDERKIFGDIGKIIWRLAFQHLQAVSVICAQVLPLKLQIGQEFDLRAFKGEPPGMFPTLNSSEQISPSLDPTLLTKSVSPEAEGALSWLHAGLEAVNPLHRAISFWCGLESLAPAVSRAAWQCSECSHQTEKCPGCGHPTSGIQSTATMRNYLRRLGVVGKEFKRLYNFRNSLSHGSAAFSHGTLEANRELVDSIENLLVIGIKAAFDIPQSALPLRTSRTCVMGAGAMVMEKCVCTAATYEMPPFFPDELFLRVCVTPDDPAVPPYAFDV